MSIGARTREKQLSSFTSRLRGGRYLAGMQHNSGSEAVLELLALAGFDFVMLDMEHASYSFGDVERLVRVAEGCGLVPLVRVNHNDPALIGQALDTGASGIVVPHIESPDSCRQALSAMRYPPLGMRGKTAGCRSALWGMTPWTEYESWANAKTLFVPLVESSCGVDQIEAIAAVEGVSCIFIGPGDLSHSYGLPGLGLRAQPVMDAVRRAVAAGRQRDIPVCTVPVPDMDAPMVRELLELGVTVVMWGVDLVHIGRYFRSITGSIGSAQPSAE